MIEEEDLTQRTLGFRRARGEEKELTQRAQRRKSGSLTRKRRAFGMTHMEVAGAIEARPASEGSPYKIPSGN